MCSIKERKYKDKLPLNTINQIRNILDDLGILTVEKAWSNSADGFYSVTVSIANTTLSTNGKGTTYEYALASAYGELMERLQNQAQFRLNTDVSQDAMEYLGYFYAPDEKRFSIDELLNNDEEWITTKLSMLNTDVSKIDLLSKWQEISYEKPPCDFIAVPFCNLNSSKLSHIPVKMLSKMYMSNGMCAGNTNEEALVQGISEVLERNVNKRIIAERITPPTIPEEYINTFPRIVEMIKQIELSGNFEVIMKDCSLGYNFPVVGVIYINKDDQTYFIKFGAHPAFEIAAERTLTELLQGQDIKNMRGVWEFSYKSNITDEHSNLVNILANGCGWYPNEFFGTKLSYEFKPFTDVSHMNNKEMVKYLVQMLHDMDYDVYARDVSFLGLPAFHVIVPGLSEIEEINDIKELDDYAEFVRVKRLIRNMENISSNEIIELVKFIEHKKFDSYTIMLQLLNLPINKDIPWYYTNANLFTTALYCKIKDYTGAFRVFSSFLSNLTPNSFNPSMLTYYKCLRDYLAARSEGLTHIQIIDLLGSFYPLHIIKGIIDELGSPENIFSNYGLIHCFDCDSCQLKFRCPYNETEKVFKIIKEKYLSSKISQEDLVNVL